MQSESVGVEGEEKSVCQVTSPFDGSPFAGPANDSVGRFVKSDAETITCNTDWVFSDDILIAVPSNPFPCRVCIGLWQGVEARKRRHKLGLSTSAYIQHANVKKMKCVKEYDDFSVFF